MQNVEIKDLDPQDFTSDKQRDLYEYWKEIRGDLSMPSRQDLNPMDIPHLLSALWMADVIDRETPKFKVRLFGTDLVRAFQLEGTNRPLEEVSFTGDIIIRLTELVRTRQSYFYVCDFPVESDDFKYYSTLTLPMSSDNENVDIILSYVHCYS